MEELHFCKLLKGHEGEIFYSPCFGEVKLEVIHTPEVSDTSYYILVRPKTITIGRELIHDDGSLNKSGVCMLYPSRSLYEKYPLDPYSAWKEWITKEDVVIEGWISRDKNNSLCLYPKKPYRFEDRYWWFPEDEYIGLPREYFSKLTWENEPQKVKIIITTNGIN